MERAKGVLMLEGDFGWNDVGSWDTLDAVRTRMLPVTSAPAIRCFWMRKTALYTAVKS